MPTETEADRLNRRVYAYFPTAGRITVAQTFIPAAGWHTWNRYHKSITASWARKLRRAGVTVVALTDGTRTADFTLAELLSKTA